MTCGWSNTGAMTINEQFADADLRRAVLGLCDQVGKLARWQQEVREQGRCEWQLEIEASVDIAALVEIGLDGGIPDVVPFGP